MPEYNNEMKGVLFKNDQKVNEKAPLYKGKIQISGVEYELAAWIRESKKGNKFMSLLASRKEEENYEPPVGGDEIPF